MTGREGNGREGANNRYAFAFLWRVCYYRALWLYFHGMDFADSRRPLIDRKSTRLNSSHS